MRHPSGRIVPAALAGRSYRQSPENRVIGYIVDKGDVLLRLVQRDEEDAGILLSDVLHVLRVCRHP